MTELLNFSLSEYFKVNIAKITEQPLTLYGVYGDLSDNGAVIKSEFYQ